MALQLIDNCINAQNQSRCFLNYALLPLKCSYKKLKCTKKIPKSTADYKEIHDPDWFKKQTRDNQQRCAVQYLTSAHDHVI